MVSPMASWVPIRAWHATNSVPVSVRAVIVTESAGEVVVMVRVNVKVPPGSSKTVGGTACFVRVTDGFTSLMVTDAEPGPHERVVIDDEDADGL